MPKKTEHDYAHKPTLFNLIACQRSSDNHIHMTGCLCHNIEAKHFWFDQPALTAAVHFLTGLSNATGQYSRR